MRSVVFSLVALALVGHASAADEIPGDVVADIHVFEARSSAPDFKAMEELAFFINTDGRGVSETQWLATIARQATDSFLATLAAETLTLETPSAELTIQKRSRRLTLSVDLSEFLAEGVFHADVVGTLARRDEAQRTFEQTIELRAGQTYVWSGRGLELSASEYLSHFRDYSDGDHRRELYDKLRNYTTFLIVALSLRRTESAPESGEVVTLSLTDEMAIPEFESPLGIEIVGTIELELVIDASGAPTDAKVVRSSIPEVNSRVLGEAEGWRFPEAGGKTGRLVLELTALP